MTRLFLFLLLLFLGCSSQDGHEQNEVHEIEVEEVSLLFSAESSTDIGSPSTIKADHDGFLIYDHAFNQIVKLDSVGNRVLAFGSEGRGPGEFQNVMGLWSFDDYYLIYDSNNAKLIKYDRAGNWLEDILVELDRFPAFPSRIEALNARQFIIPSGGKNGSLLAFADMGNQHIEYFGEAVGEYVQTIDPERMNQAISSGNIPEIMKNRVLLGANATGIFSFQQTTAVLEKYSHSRDPVWQKKINISALDGLFDQIFNMHSQDNRNSPAPSFHYAKRMSVTPEGVALLLHVLDDQPVTVAWVPNDGEEVTVVTFPEIKNQPGTLAVTEDHAFIFFVDALNGNIHKAEWPL